MKAIVHALAVFFFISFTSLAHSADSASTIAESWLKLIDAGKYDQSWKDSAELFRNAMSSKAWTEMVVKVRKPLGKVISRKVGTQKVMTALPGAPDGKYTVIEFHTTYEFKKDSVETVTPMLEKDGKWRVSGYYIR